MRPTATVAVAAVVNSERPDLHTKRNPPFWQPDRRVGPDHEDDSEAETREASNPPALYLERVHRIHRRRCCAGRSFSCMTMASRTGDHLRGRGQIQAAPVSSRELSSTKGLAHAPSWHGSERRRSRPSGLACSGW